MSCGNIAISNSCSWDTTKHCLILPSGGYGVSSSPFTPGADGSYSVSIAMQYNPAYTRHDDPIIGMSYMYECRSTDDLFMLSRYSYNLQVGYRYAANSGSCTWERLVDFFDSSGADINLVIDMVYTTSSITVYKNGAIFHQWSISGSTFTPSTKLGLNCYTDSSGLYATCNNNISIYAINLYDRALTQEEVELNFNTYNSRYSLNL